MSEDPYRDREPLKDAPDRIRLMSDQEVDDEFASGFIRGAFCIVVLWVVVALVRWGLR